MLKPFVWRSIGPANMGGRVDDIAVVESNPIDHLRRLRDRRHLEDDQQRHDVDADLRHVSGLVDWRHRDCARRTRTSSTSAPASRTTARARRSAPASTSPTDAGKTFQYDGPQGHAEHRPRSSSTRRIPNIVVRRGARPSVRTEPGTRALQDDRRRQDLDEHEVHRRRHRLHGRRDGSRQSERALSPRRTSGGARRGASTAAARAAASGRRPTPARRGRS